MAILDAAIKNRALQAAEILGRMANVHAAYVFGSHAEGRADRWSDIDVAVFMDDVEHWDIHQRAKAMSKVMQEAGSDVEAHLFGSDSLSRPEQGSFAQYILKNGICVYHP